MPVVSISPGGAAGMPGTLIVTLPSLLELLGSSGEGGRSSQRAKIAFPAAIPDIGGESFTGMTFQPKQPGRMRGAGLPGRDERERTAQEF